jgi:hypothetical protein
MSAEAEAACMPPYMYACIEQPVGVLGGQPRQHAGAVW